MATLFQNHQWAVTDYGLQSVPPGAPYEYNIAANSLIAMLGEGEGECYDWPIHMASKSWIDFDAFIEAYKQALDLHANRYNGTADPEKVAESIRQGWKRIELYQGP